MVVREWSNSVPGPINVVNANETVAITTVPVSTGIDGEPVNVSGSFNITAGAGTTGITVRVRRGVGIAGALVGNAVTHTLAAAASGSIPFDVNDVPGAVAGQQYSVTVVQVAGAANGTVNFADADITLGQ